MQSQTITRLMDNLESILILFTMNCYYLNFKQQLLLLASLLPHASARKMFDYQFIHRQCKSWLSGITLNGAISSLYLKEYTCDVECSFLFANNFRLNMYLILYIFPKSYTCPIPASKVKNCKGFLFKTAFKPSN